MGEDGPVTAVVAMASTGLACAGCGQEVLDPSRPTVVADSLPHVPSLTGKAAARLPMVRVVLARCADCQRLHDRAVAWVSTHPAYVASVGPGVAVERVESALLAMAALDQPMPRDATLATMVNDLWQAGTAARFSSPATVRPGVRSALPWAHVEPATWQRLRDALASAMRARLTRVMPDARIVCPSAGCAYCGLSAVIVAADRAGGTYWRPVVASPAAFGVRGADLLRGHVCTSCAESIDAVGGSIGPTSRVRAICEHLRRSGQADKARRLAAEQESDWSSPPRAWISTRKPPSVAAWAHLSRLFAAL